MLPIPSSGNSRMRQVGLIVASLALAACRTPAPHAATEAPTRTAAAPHAVVDVEEAGIAELQARMARGELTSRQLTQAYLDRIAALDAAGPALHAVLAIDPQALADADARDSERAAGHVRGPLHGIPVLLKDNIDALPMATTAGSLALADHHPPRDAFLVAKLRAAGAVILGKTNLSEWANFRSTRSVSGWSGVGGQTKNAYVLDRNPCGSSAGTGTAIAASLAAVGIGTETDGSIICPSSVAALVGLKPTVGLVSRDGIVPISRSQDTAGPMARSVADAATLLTAIAASDANDADTADASRHATDYTAHLEPDALRGARIGVVRKSMGFHPDVDAAMERAIATMRAAGATVVDADIPTAGKWDDAELQVLLYEFKDGLPRYLASRQAPVHSLAELIAFDRTHAAMEMPWFGQELFEQAEAKGPLTERGYLDARHKARQLAGARGIDAALRAKHLDALIAPASGPAWRTDVVLGDHFTGAGYGAAAVAGYPSLTVPMGDSHGLPLGIVFMGTAWSEPRLIELGYAFEQLMHARHAPRFVPTLEGATSSGMP
jgi:amidase